MGDVATLIKEIAASSREQAAGVEHINKALSEIDSAVQHNTALVQETAVSSEVMREQARQLSKLMEFFKLAEVDAAPPAPNQSEITPSPQGIDPSQQASRGFPQKPETAQAPAPAAATVDNVAWQKAGTDDWDAF